MRVGQHWSLLDRLSQGRFRTRVRTTNPVLYLTFDDGPHPRHTAELLALLARYGAQATFFMVGKAAEQNPAVALQVAGAGHSLGNHSYSHARQTTISAAQRRDEFRRTDNVLQNADHRALHTARPPYGAVPYVVALQCLLGTCKLTLWSYDSLDYRGNADDVIRRLQADSMRPGEILLFHDDDATALRSLEVLLPFWQQQGFSFSALDPH